MEYLFPFDELDRGVHAAGSYPLGGHHFAESSPEAVLPTSELEGCAVNDWPRGQAELSTVGSAAGTGDDALHGDGCDGRGLPLTSDSDLWGGHVWEVVTILNVSVCDAGGGICSVGNLLGGGLLGWGPSPTFQLSQTMAKITRSSNNVPGAPDEEGRAFGLREAQEDLADAREHRVFMEQANRAIDTSRTVLGDAAAESQSLTDLLRSLNSRADNNIGGAARVERQRGEGRGSGGSSGRRRRSDGPPVDRRKCGGAPQPRDGDGKFGSCR